MTTSEELVERMRPLDRGQVAAFAVGCATRLEPVFTAFWRTTPPATYDEWLHQLWSLVDAPASTPTNRLVAAVMATPEANVDDSSRPDYYAMRVLGVVVYAAQVIGDDDPLRSSLWCSRGALSLLRDFDHILARDSDSLAALELAAQEDSVDRLARGGTLTMENCQSSEVFRRLPEATADVARALDWDLSGR